MQWFLLLRILIYQWIHPKTAFYYICNLWENLWKGSLFLGSFWISHCTHISFCFEGFYDSFSFFCWCAFTFHTWVRFIKSVFHEMGITTHIIVIIISKIIFTLSFNISCNSNKILIKSFSDGLLISDIFTFNI